MIIKNFVAGKDRFGKNIYCGDVCLFEVKIEKEIKKMKGMVVYDESSYAFAFETLDNYAPILLMKCAEYRTIEKLFEANQSNFESIPDGKKWEEVYKNNLF